jgi:hypothetical protein
MSSKFHPNFFGLNVRRNGPQPSICVGSFGPITTEKGRYSTAMAGNQKRVKMLQYRLKSEASLRNDFGRLRNNGTEKNDKEEVISGLEQLA